MEGTKPAPDGELLAFAREGEVRAVFLVCEEMEPADFDTLARHVVPDGLIIVKVFDALADGYDLWRQSLELAAVPGVEPPLR